MFFFQNFIFYFQIFLIHRYFENRDKQNRLLRQSNIHTVGENVIATNKMRNNFCYPLKIGIYLLLPVCDSKRCRS